MARQKTAPDRLRADSTIKENRKQLREADQIKEDFALDPNDIKNIFDLIDEDHGDLDEI